MQTLLNGWNLTRSSSVQLFLISLQLLVLFGCGNPNPTSLTSPSTPTPHPSLAVWKNNFNGVPFTMVGTDPSLPNAGTTQIPTVVVPVRLNFNGLVITPEETPCGDTASATQRTMNSPVFQSANWNPSVFQTSNTQFGDAFQRANFSSIISKNSPNYHVLLGPISQSAPITLNIPPIPGAALGANPLCPGQYYGAVPQTYLDSLLQQALVAIKATPNELVVFLTYDTEFPLQNGGVWLGYHSNSNGQTYMVASYMDSSFAQIFGTRGAVDISVLSHEMGEWMDNPLGVNAVPAWGDVGIEANCSTQLEVGDPLVGYVGQYTDSSGFAYHLQELAYFSWFARNTPSLAIDERYSTLGTFTTYAPPCLSGQSTSPASHLVTLKSPDRLYGPLMSPTNAGVGSSKSMEQVDY